MVSHYLHLIYVGRIILNNLYLINYQRFYYQQKIFYQHLNLFILNYDCI
jgi:hypothetical protein